MNHFYCAEIDLPLVPVYMCSIIFLSITGCMINVSTKNLKSLYEKICQQFLLHESYGINNFASKSTITLSLRNHTECFKNAL